MSENNVIDMKSGEPLPPDFITRVDINKMSDPELDDFIEAIRTRRMANFIIYQQTAAEMEALNQEKAKAKLEKKVEQVAKTCETLDKQFEKLEKQINELRGLRIQAGMSVL